MRLSTCIWGRARRITMAWSRNGRCAEDVDWGPLRAADDRLRGRCFCQEASRETLNPAGYDDWHDSERGCWIGEVEYRLLLNEFAPHNEIARFLRVRCRRWSAGSVAQSDGLRRLDQCDEKYVLSRLLLTFFL